MLLKVINANNEERYIDPEAVQLVYREKDVTVIVLDGPEVETKEGVTSIVSRIDDAVGR